MKNFVEIINWIKECRFYRQYTEGNGTYHFLPPHFGRNSSTSLSGLRRTDIESVYAVCFSRRDFRSYIGYFPNGHPDQKETSFLFSPYLEHGLNGSSFVLTLWLPQWFTNSKMRIINPSPFTYNEERVQIIPFKLFISSALCALHHSCFHFLHFLQQKCI